MPERYNTPSSDATEWDVPINENFTNLDVDVTVKEARAPDAAQESPESGAMFLDTSTGDIYLADGSSWGSPVWNLNDTEWQDSGAAVTTDRTANFRDNLTVTQGANGEAIIDASGGSGDSTVVESFSTGDTSHYEGDTNAFSVIAGAGVAGNNVLEFDGSTGTEHYAIATDTIETERMMTYATHVRPSLDTNLAVGFILCATIDSTAGEITKGYNVTFDPGDGSFRIVKKTSTGGWYANALDSDTVTITAGTLYRIEVALGASTITARLVDTSSNEIVASAQATDAEYATGYWGYHGASSASETGQFEFGVQTAQISDDVPSVSDDGTQVYADVAEVNFGSDLNVTDDGNNAVTVNSTASTSGGSWNVYNITDYGADPTGASDSTTAIQNACDDAAADTPSGMVFIPAGDYKVKQVNLTNTHNGITIRGQGRASRLFLPGDLGVNVKMFNVDSTYWDYKNVTIEHLYLDGTAPGTTVNTYAIVDSRRSAGVGPNWYQNLWVEGFSKQSLWLSHSHTVVRNCEIWNGWASGVNYTDQADGHFRYIYNVHSHGHSQNNLHGNGFNLSKGSVMCSNIASYNNQHGAKISELGGNIIISNALFKDNAEWGWRETPDTTENKLIMDNVISMGNGKSGFSFRRNTQVMAGTLYALNNGAVGIRTDWADPGPNVSINNAYCHNNTNEGVRHEAGHLDIGRLYARGNSDGLEVQSGTTADVMNLSLAGNNTGVVNNGDLWVARSRDYTGSQH